MFALESTYHIYVFRMMSCMRILRLLFITSGTSVILRSLKRSAPTLLNVAFLIGFFWLLFAIIGVQSFKSSLRRTCVWNWDNANRRTTVICSEYDRQFPVLWLLYFFRQRQHYALDHCRRRLGNCNTERLHMSLCFFLRGGRESLQRHCVSFDNILQSVELVFVVMTSNTFTDLMYYLTNSDYLAAALFFAFGTTDPYILADLFAHCRHYFVIPGHSRGKPQLCIHGRSGRPNRNGKKGASTKATASYHPITKGI